VKSFPALSSGFEIETELTIHALELRMPCSEVETLYSPRALGTASKLRTFRDGSRIAWTILRMLKSERPLQFFFAIGTTLFFTSVGVAIPIFIEYGQTGQVPRFPTAILATGLMILAFLSLASGFILDTVTQGRRETKRMWYLSLPEPGLAVEPTADSAT
jgi:hypothetical protein